MSVDDHKPPSRDHAAGLDSISLRRADADRLWARICARRPVTRSRAPRSDAASTLPRPVSPLLRRGEELLADRAQVWRAVKARAVRTREEQRRGPIRHAALALASLTLVVAGVLWLSDGAEPTPTHLVTTAQDGPLTLRDGSAIAPVEAHTSNVTVELRDESSILLSPGTRIVPLVSTATSLELLLERGSALFSVTPGGPRRWIVDAGSARVEVVGTVFRVERSEKHIVVSVDRGTVLVRGESVPGLVKKLSAGERLSLGLSPRSGSPGVDDATEPPAAAEVAQTEKLESNATRRLVEAPATSGAPPVSEAPRIGKTAQAAGTRLGKRVEPRDKPTPRRRPSPTETVDTLLQKADEARLSGRPSRAVKPLEQALARFADSPQAGLIAFTLGRLRLDQLNQPRRAAVAFEKALAIGLPRALEPECHRRLIEAYGQVGDHVAAKRTLERLVRRFPENARAEELDRWLEP